MRWFTDNQNVVHILQVGSKRTDLHAIAHTIFKLAIKYQVRLEPNWVPRKLNKQADYLSRIIDFDDWYLNPDVFAELDIVRGPHTVERFANCNNCKYPVSIAGIGAQVLKL